ncbi:hypothetical protein VTK73DRAFT_1161 [Phialemonium thermophilum]|uniref:Uncharacterized protein n=1 Tax=Phialemonium thermophilum TaxID=223376 RepID=A0ABR3VTT9_9PEZI
MNRALGLWTTRYEHTYNSRVKTVRHAHLMTSQPCGSSALRWVHLLSKYKHRRAGESPCLLDHRRGRSQLHWTRLQVPGDRAAHCFKPAGFTPVPTRQLHVPFVMCCILSGVHIFLLTPALYVLGSLWRWVRVDDCGKSRHAFRRLSTVLIQPQHSTQQDHEQGRPSIET